MVLLLTFSWKKIKIKPHALFDFLKNVDEKQVFFLEWPNGKKHYSP